MVCVGAAESAAGVGAASGVVATTDSVTGAGGSGVLVGAAVSGAGAGWDLEPQDNGLYQDEPPELEAVFGAVFTAVLVAVFAAVLVTVFAAASVTAAEFRVSGASSGVFVVTTDSTGGAGRGG